MKRVVTASQMKQLDANTIDYHRIGSPVLMERAALFVADELTGTECGRILVVCGTGNNGGDGIAAARILKMRGFSVDLYQPDTGHRKSADCVLQEEIARSYHVTWVNNPAWDEYTTIVDAIFGVGLSRDLDGIYAETVKKINESGAFVTAVDMPSGIDSDTGQVLGCAVKANKTITFAFPKAGQLLRPGCEYCGELKICDIGIYECNGLEKPNSFCMEKEDLCHIPVRADGGNKGTFGKVLLVAGSDGMAGAAYLSGLAAMRSGCGMVKILTPVSNREILQTSVPEIMLSVYHTKQEALEKLSEGLKWADTVGIGPGLGQSETAAALVEQVLIQSKHPMVLDADALNLLVARKDLLSSAKGPVMITPHLGEMARLIGCRTAQISSKVLATARSFAEKYQVQCVLKDSRTCVALPDGTAWINPTGNSGMATAGSGDVLCGILLGLLAQKTPFTLAGALGVWIHGRLGDRVSSRNGPGFLMAGDLIEELKFFRIGDTKGDCYEEI